MNVRRTVCLVAALLAAIWLTNTFTSGQEMTLSSQVIERILPNGLKVLMVKRTDAPLIRCILAYRVGSVNERPGITGMSHFHEHMMFKGTYSMGIKPGTLAKDDEYNRQIDALMEQVAAEESKVKGRDDSEDRGVEETGLRADRQGEEGDDRQRGDLGRLPEGGRHRDQRLDRQRDDAVLRHPAEEQARAVPGARGGPPRQPRVPRVLLRARRHHRGTPDEREPAGLLLPGAAERDVLRREPVRLGRRRLDVGHQPRDEEGDDRVPQPVLPARQRHAGAGRRPRSRPR